MSARPRTRLLGVDYGTVRIGLAVTDADRIIASPLEIRERQGDERDAAYFRDIIEREQISGLVSNEIRLGIERPFSFDFY